MSGTVLGTGYTPVYKATARTSAISLSPVIPYHCSIVSMQLAACGKKGELGQTEPNN